MHKRGYQRHREDQRRNKRRSQGSPVYGGAWFDEEQGRYIRTYRWRRSKELKKLSNKKIRYDKSDINYSHGLYRRKYDYWWEID